MPGYQIKQENVPITGVADLFIRSLLDRQQFSDPLGAALRQGISSATWPLFGLLWPSGAQLAARMALRPVLAGERILELGCGLALPSLVGHRRGADITASDCHPLTRGFLQANLVLNQLLPMKYRHGHWSQPGSLKQEDGAPAIDMVRGRFDLIIGSDLLYDPDASVALAGFIGRHAKRCAEVWIVDPDRGNRAAFSRHMLAQGFGLREERLDRIAASDTLAYKGRLLTYRRSPRRPEAVDA
ncbi:MAG: SAM-dependent methyltransferase [Hylemonella sp.]|nr:SAM-dependent methyltransferase [Hylemonella sp.]